jgi:acetylornithine/succinyldiaminopimelate/putrescine aminotransferase
MDAADAAAARVEHALESFGAHVSPAKLKFFQGYGLDLVMGERERCTLKGLPRHDGEPAVELLNLHCNGGVFNLGHANQEVADALRAALDDHLDIGNHHLISEHRARTAEMLAEVLPVCFRTPRAPPAPLPPPALSPL